MAQKLPVIVIAHVRQQKRATARWASTRWLRCSARDGVINGEQAIAIVAKHWRVPATAEHSYVAIGIVSFATAGRAKHSSASGSTRAC